MPASDQQFPTSPAAIAAVGSRGPRPLRLVQRLSGWQAPFVECDAWLVAAFGGRGSGKTRAGAEKKIERRLRYPGSIGLSGASTYQQTRYATMRQFLLALAAYGIAHEVDRRPRDAALAGRMRSMGLTDFHGVVTLPNGSAEVFRTFGAHDALRGYEVADIWIDESRELSYDAFVAVQPCLRGHGAIAYQIILTTSPRGYDWNHDVVVDRESPRYVPDSRWFHATSHENPFNPAGYADRLLRSLSPQMARQEVQAEFISADGAVWPELQALPQPAGNLLPWSLDAGAPVRIAVDFGYRSPAIILLQSIRFPEEHALLDREGQPLDRCDVVIDECLPVNCRTDELVDWLNHRRRNHAWAASGAVIEYGLMSCDPAGAQVNAQSGSADVDLFRRAGFRVRPLSSKSSHRLIPFGCNLVGSRWCNARGERRLYIACRDATEAASGQTSLCPKALRAFRTYAYRSGRDDAPVDERPMKGGPGAPDHACDALRYDQVNHHGHAWDRVHERRY